MGNLIDEYVNNHEFFVEKKEYDNVFSYIFKEKEREYVIIVLKRMDERIFEADSEYFGMEIKTPEPGIWKSPDWFKETAHHINELFFKMNRVWLVVNNKRRPVEDIFWSYCLVDEFGVDFYNYIRDDFSFNDVSKENFSTLFTKIRSALHEEKYTVEITEEDEERFFYFIS